MGFSRWLGRQVARTRYAQRAVREQADLSAFRSPPRGRLLVGLICIGASFLIAWPLIAVFGFLAWLWSEPLLIVIGGPAAYATSWGVWSLGMLLTGAENVRYGHLFLRYLVRRLVERSTAQGAAGAVSGAPAETPSAGGSGGDAGSSAGSGPRSSCTSSSDKE